MFGNLELEAGRNFSSQLLSDVESLLIAYEQPRGTFNAENHELAEEILKLNVWVIGLENQKIIWITDLTKEFYI